MAEEKAQSDGPEVDVKAVAEHLATMFEVKLDPLNEMAQQITTLAKAFDGLAERLEALEGQERIKKEVETPRFVLSLGTKASEAQETVVDDDDPLLDMKPVETKAKEGSGASHFFGSK